MKPRATAKKYRVGRPFVPYGVFPIFSLIPEPIERLPTKELSQGAKLAYGRLMRYSGKDGRCFPSEATLGVSLGVKEKQARNYISELAQKGFIAKRQRGLKQTNQYEFLWHKSFD